MIKSTITREQLRDIAWKEFKSNPQLDVKWHDFFRIFMLGWEMFKLEFNKLDTPNVEFNSLIEDNE